MVAVRVDIGEYGGDFLPLQRVCGRNEGVGRHDDFAPELKSANSYFQGYGGIAHADAMPHISDFADSLFKFPDDRAIVGKPSSLKDLLDPFKQPARIANVRAADVEWFGEARLPTFNGQRIHSFCLHHAPTLNQQLLGFSTT